MVLHMKLSLCISFLLGIYLFLGSSCTYAYVPDAQGTPRPVLVIPTPTLLSASPTEQPVKATPKPSPSAIPAILTPLPTPDTIRLAPTPAPTPLLRRLTTPGCCSGIWWSADGTKVLFVDKPDERPEAIWGVDIATEEQAPYSKAVGLLQHDDRYVITPLYRTMQSVTVHDRETGEDWLLPHVGSLVFISPDASFIAYDGRSAQQPIFANRREASIFVAALDGSNPRFLTKIYGGGILGWYPNSTNLLFLGTETFGAQRPSLWYVNVTTDEIEKLEDAEQMHNISISPDGAWAVFLILFEKDSFRNTTWALNLINGDQRRLGFDGRYAWIGNEGATLVYVPLRKSANEGFALWKLNIDSGERFQLTDPSENPLFIANGDWVLAPNGKHFAFVSSEDYAIWLLELSP